MQVHLSKKRASSAVFQRRRLGVRVERRLDVAGAQELDRLRLGLAFIQAFKLAGKRMAEIFAWWR